MDLPSSRELELETLLRLRDTQLTELTDELTHLRKFLLSQPGPSSTEPTTLPPALVSVLSPHLHVAPSLTVSGAPLGSNTVNAALTQRARSLQEENDELYNILKVGETGKLKEEVRGLRRVVARLEGALRESHQVITSLSTELDKSYSSLLAAARPSHSANNSSKSISQSPRAAYHPSLPSESTGNTNGPSTMTKLPPTGPRAFKKPRLSEPQPQQKQDTTPSSSSQRNAPLPPQHKSYSRAHSSSRGADTREYPRRGDGRGKGGGNSYVKMEVDEDPQQRVRPASPVQERERERDRDRERERDRGGRDRERDGHGRHRRNGGRGFGGGGGRGSRTGHDSTSANDSAHGGDRTLRERLGL